MKQVCKFAGCDNEPGDVFKSSGLCGKHQAMSNHPSNYIKTNLVGNSVSADYSSFVTKYSETIEMLKSMVVMDEPDQSSVDAHGEMMRAVWSEKEALSIKDLFASTSDSEQVCDALAHRIATFKDMPAEQLEGRMLAIREMLEAYSVENAQPTPAEWQENFNHQLGKELRRRLPEHQKEAIRALMFDSATLGIEGVDWRLDRLKKLCALPNVVKADINYDVFD